MHRVCGHVWLWSCLFPCAHACGHVCLRLWACVGTHTHVSWLCIVVDMPGCVRVFVGTHAYLFKQLHQQVYLNSVMQCPELGALDFEEGPWFCRLLCPSLESVFNYPPHCAKSGVSARCHSLLLSRPPGRPLLSRSLRGCVLLVLVIGTGPLKSPGGLCHEHGFKCLPCLQIWKEAVPFVTLHLATFT